MANNYPEDVALFSRHPGRYSEGGYQQQQQPYDQQEYPEQKSYQVQIRIPFLANQSVLVVFMCSPDHKR